MKLLGLLMAGALLASAQTQFDKLIDRFYEDYFRFNPSAGTAVGFHQYDTSFEDYSQGNMHAYVAMLRSYIPKFEKAPVSEDRDLVLMKIHSELLAVEDIHYWTNKPDFYSSSATESIF